MMVTPALRQLSVADVLEPVVRDRWLRPLYSGSKMALEALVGVMTNVETFHESLPRSYCLRFAHEKRGYWAFRVGRQPRDFLEALPWYEQALTYVTPTGRVQDLGERRGELKVRGGYALSLYLGDAGRRDEAVRELERLVEEAGDEPRFRRIAEAAKTNLKTLRGNPDSMPRQLKHFDIP